MKNFTRKLTLLLMGLSFVFAAEAQKVSGIVKDSAGSPIIGASVVVEGTTVGTSTGISGEWNLDVPNAPQKKLVFSYLGMKDQTVAIGNRTYFEIVLEGDAEVMEDVVVVGYATVQRKDLIGSVSSVSSETLASQPVTSVSEALSGKMAGVQVTTTEGDPDADIKIRVRGGGSITQDSSPLYIVDGFPVESINDIPSSDIQSIDVLKDAFSTAIYGSRGANGVIIVTTKSGKEGRLSVNYNGYMGVKAIANKDALVTLDTEEFVKLQYELAMLRDQVEGNYEPYFGQFCDIDLYAGQPKNDYVAQVFGNQGSTSNHNISLSGGSDSFNWTASYSHMGDNAIMKGSTYTRDNLNLKTKFKPNKRVSFDFSVRFSDTNVRGSGANSINDSGSTSGNGRLKHAIGYSPIPLKSSVESSDLEEDYGDNAPPMLSVADNDSKRSRENWNVNGAVSLKLLKGLTLKVEGGLDKYNQDDNRYYGLTTYYVNNNATIKGQPATSYIETDRTKLRNTNTIHYNIAEALDWEDSKLDVLVGQEYVYTNSDKLTAWVEGLPTFFDADMAWNFMASGTATSTNKYYNPDDKLLSFFGRVNYDWNGILSLSGTMRADGSSKFLGANRWGYFPSAAAAIRLSEIGALQDVESLDNLKLRYSYGTAGNNNIPSGQTLQTFKANTTSWISQGVTYWSAGNTMPNPDLKWETTISHNLGLDFSFGGGKLSGSVELYKNNTKDLLIQFPTSGSGYANQYRNMGETENKGFEATLNLTLFQTKNAGLTISANASYNRNKVVTLGGLDRIESQSTWASTEVGTDYVVEVGQPLGNMYGYQSDGFYTTDDFNYVDGKWELKEGVVDCSDIIGSNFLRPGARKYKDQPTVEVLDEEGNVVGYEGDGKLTVDDKTVIGNALADWTGGLIISGYIGNLDFSANFNAVFGNQIYNANSIEFTSTRKFHNRNLLASMSTDQRWTNIDWATGEFITDPEALAALNEGKAASPFIQNAVFSDAAVEDGSFIRLSSVTVGYTLPKALTQRVGVENLRFYVSGTNLWLLTNYSGYDPEVDTRRATPLTPGVDYSAYPKSKGVVFGVNLTF
ncbi:MAG: TonB-dependent receptor [Tidjanibacter sp.]|nr:TonB-dependent receptor [Tidjanibacter sp.]